jgi:hypothetical protein
MDEGNCNKSSSFWSETGKYLHENVCYANERLFTIHHGEECAVNVPYKVNRLLIKCFTAFGGDANKLISFIGYECNDNCIVKTHALL